MIRARILALGFCFALAAPLADPAAAQTPALRANVTVTGDVVRIGDLIDNAGAVADVPIFRAPDLGTRGAVATDRIVEAIRPHQLTDGSGGAASEQRADHRRKYQRQPIDEEQCVAHVTIGCQDFVHRLLQQDIDRIAARVQPLA